MYFYHTYDDSYTGPAHYGELRSAPTMDAAIRGCRRQLVKDTVHEGQSGMILKARNENVLSPKNVRDRLDSDRYIYFQKYVLGTVTTEPVLGRDCHDYYYHPVGSKSDYLINKDGSLTKI